jgi:hypothetical protein
MRWGIMEKIKTTEHLRTYFWFSKMRRRVKKYLAACIECAYHKRPGGRREGTLYPWERVAIPFSTVHIDHLGPFPRSKRGNEYVLAYQDSFTKFIIL